MFPTMAHQINYYLVYLQQLPWLNQALLHVESAKTPLPILLAAYTPALLHVELWERFSGKFAEM